MDDIKAWLDGNRSYTPGVALYRKYGKDPLLIRLFQEQYSDFKAKKLAAALESLVAPKPSADTPPPADRAPVVKPADAPKHHQVSETPASVKQIRNELLGLQDDLGNMQYDLETLEEKAGEVETLKRDLQHVERDVKKLKLNADQVPKGWPAKMDEVVQAMHNDWRPLFLEKKNLQARIYDVALAGENDPIRKEEARQMALRILKLREKIRRIYRERDEYLVSGTLPPVEPPLPNVDPNPRSWPKKLANHQKYLRDRKAELRTLEEKLSRLPEKSTHLSASHSEEKLKKDIARVSEHIALQERYVAHYKEKLGES